MANSKFSKYYFLKRDSQRQEGCQSIFDVEVEHICNLYPLRDYTVGTAATEAANYAAQDLPNDRMMLTLNPRVITYITDIVIRVCQQEKEVEVTPYCC